MSSRTVIQADAMAWLAQAGRLTGASVVTSLPDVSEVPELGFAGWREFFRRAAALVAACVPDEGVAVFYQSDIKHEGTWVDKGYLVQRSIEDADAGLVLLWHKIVCRRPPGHTTFGRAAYSHMLCFGRRVRAQPAKSTPDVLPGTGAMPWSKAMGVDACIEACRFILQQTETRTVIDPFCGYGTLLAVANAMGLDAIGVDISARKCRKARQLSVELPHAR